MKAEDELREASFHALATNFLNALLFEIRERDAEHPLLDYEDMERAIQMLRAFVRDSQSFV